MCSDKYEPDYVTVRDYFEALLLMTQKAVDLARNDMERRMDGFPEQFIRKGEVDVSLTELKAKVEVLIEAKNKMEGKASQQSMIISLVISIIALIIALGGLLRHFKV